MNSVTGHAPLHVAPVELQSEEEVAEVRGPVGCDGSEVARVRVTQGVEVQFGGGVRGVPGEWGVGGGGESYHKVLIVDMQDH